jgi:cytochrome c biogenesis factor
MRNRSLQWVEHIVTYYIWAFGILLAHLAVIRHIIAFPDSQLRLVILLYVFDAALVISLTLRIYQQFRRRQ